MTNSKKKLFGALENNELDWRFLNYDEEKKNERNWTCINFLQTKDLILIPKFNIDEDVQALEQIKVYFPEYSNRHRI